MLPYYQTFGICCTLIKANGNVFHLKVGPCRLRLFKISDDNIEADEISIIIEVKQEGRGQKANSN